MVNPCQDFLGYLRATFFLGLWLMTFNGNAQGCECPPANSCGPCSGGLTALTLKFNGGASSLVTVEDGSGVFYSSTLNTGDEFSISGTLSNGKFQGPTITLKIAAVTNTTLSSGCSSPVSPGETYGSFKIISGSSFGGGALCCSPSQIETVAPIFTFCPTDISVDLSAGTCTKAVSWSIPTATDNCELESITGDHTPGEQFPLGTTLVTYTATDAYANQATCTFNITVNDTQPPLISGCPTTVTVSSGAGCNATASWNVPLASDNCNLASFVSNHTPGSVFPFGTTQVIYTAIDVSGNTSTCTFDVVVIDTTPPVITNCPSDILVTVSSSCSAVVTWPSLVATDNCGIVTIAGDHLSGETFPIGVTQITCMATDANGNSASCTFNVIVTNEAPPQITNCPTDIIVTTDVLAEKTAASWNEPTASVVCGSVSLISNFKPGDNFPIGTTQVNYMAIGPAGRTSTCSFNVTVTFVAGDVEVSKVVTPDGDGFNDRWDLKNIDQYENNVVVVDRWGGLIYKATNYNNTSVVWDGSNTSGGLAPTGTYFYTLEIIAGDQIEKRRGFIELIR